MPWYFLCYDGNTRTTAGYGVRVRPNAMCVWHADGEGVTLYLDVRSGGMGVILGGRTLSAAEIICREYTDTDAFSAGHSFCREMCTDPIFPREPVYGSNNWYYAYGKSSHDEILNDSAYIAELCEGLENRPYMVIDDGWQDYPTIGPWDHGNDKFGDMGVLAKEMKAHNIKPGIWIRLLCDKDPSIPAEWKSQRNAEYLDPSVDAVLDYVRTTTRRLVDWGYTLIKHDYSTYDMFGYYGMHMGTSVTDNGWHFRDRSKTSAEVVLNFYRAIREGAGDAVIIGCNTFSHLCAGLVEVNRTGDDTSGRYWDRTRKMGVNTLAFRMMQNRAFYMADADCIGITDMVPWEQNRVWLKALSRSGSPLFMSSAKGVANDEMIAEIREAFRYNSTQEDVLVPVDWTDNLCPGDWLLNGQKLHLCWYPESGYDALDPIGNII
ncbi:MAG: alpha-galactosidase [Eubacteriales bacterium]